MSLMSRLLGMLGGAGAPGGKGQVRSSHVRVIEHSSRTIIAGGDGVEMELPSDLVAQVAASVGLSAEQVAELLGQEAGRELLVDLAARGSTESVATPALNPARRVRCSGCQRTVARGRGICLYCGADLPLEEAAEAREATAATGRTLQEEVDGRYVSDQPATQPSQAEREEQLAFLRRLSHM
jgi:hypothetical protein